MNALFIRIAATLLYFYSSEKRKKFRRRHSSFGQLNRKLLRAGIIGEHTYLVPGCTVADGAETGLFVRVVAASTIRTEMPGGSVVAAPAVRTYLPVGRVVASPAV